MRKTLKLFKKYESLIGEQLDDLTVSGDATEAPEVPDAETSAIGDAAGEGYLIDLAVSAFLHTPTLDEKEMIAETYKKFRKTSPNQVATVIKSILGSQQNNSRVQDLLAKTE